MRFTRKLTSSKGGFVHSFRDQVNLPALHYRAVGHPICIQMLFIGSGTGTTQNFGVSSKVLRRLLNFWFFYSFSAHV